MIKDKSDKVIVERFESLFSRYQIGLENSMKRMTLSLILLIYCIKKVKTDVNHIQIPYIG